jgi:signal peptidase II
MPIIPAQAAVRSPGARWAAAGIITTVVAADQVTKSLVLAGRISGSTGWAAVRLARNTGSAGGVESGHPVLVSLLALAITAVAVAAALRARHAITVVSLSFVVAGALGNLADRAFRAPGLGRGAVVDWIHLAAGGGSMNISDLAINVGAAGVVVSLLATREKAASRGPAGEAGPLAQDGP